MRSRDFVFGWTPEGAFCRLPAGAPLPEGWVPADVRPDRSWGVTGRDLLGDLTKLPPTRSAAAWFFATYAARDAELPLSPWHPTFDVFCHLVAWWAPRVALWRQSLGRGGEGWVESRLRPWDGPRGAGVFRPPDRVFEAGRRWVPGRGWRWVDPEAVEGGPGVFAVRLRLELYAVEGAGPAAWVAVALAREAQAVVGPLWAEVVPKCGDGRFGLRRVYRTAGISERVPGLLLEEILTRYPPPEGRVCARPGCGARVVGRGRKARYCSDRCADADRQARYQARKRNRQAAPGGVTGG